MKFAHASAYTLGKKTNGKLEKNGTFYTPGPGQYSPQSGLSAPKWKIGSEERSRPHKLNNPGPGQYSLNNLIGNGPKFTISSKSGYVDMNKYIVSPGPGMYVPKNNFSSAAYTISGRPNSAQNYITPGPGNYDVRSEKSLQVPSYKFGSEKRDGLALSQNRFVPGPGNYTANQLACGPSQPKFSFGKEGRGNQVRPMTPGPGQYQHREILGKDGPKITIGMKPRTSKLDGDFLPGPGNYTLSLGNRPKTPSYTIGSAKRDGLSKFNEFNPGPGQYTPSGFSASTRPKSPVWSMGTGNRPPLSNCPLNPGPGNYIIGRNLGQGPKYTMVGKGNIMINNSIVLVPGPGQYNADTQCNMYKNPAWKIGSGSREDYIKNVMKENLPGPGLYDSRSGHAGPQYKFGNEKRGGNIASETPGPGQYHIPCAIVDVNGYTRGAGAFDPNFKYI